MQMMNRSKEEWEDVIGRTVHVEEGKIVPVVLPALLFGRNSHRSLFLGNAVE